MQVRELGCVHAESQQKKQEAQPEKIIKYLHLPW